MPDFPQPAPSPKRSLPRFSILLICLLAIESLYGGTLIWRAAQAIVPVLPARLTDDPYLDREIHALATQVRQSQSVTDWMKLGQALLGHGFYDHAELAFRNVIELEPQNQEARFCLAFCLERTGRMAESDPEYRLAIQLDDHSSESRQLAFFSWIAIGRNLLRQEKEVEAEDIFRRTLEYRPQRLQLIRLLIRSGRSEEALTLIAAGQKELPRSLEYQFFKYEALRELNQLAEAKQVAGTLDQFQRLISLNFNSTFVGHYRQHYGIDREVQEFNQFVKRNELTGAAKKLNELIQGLAGVQHPSNHSLRIRLAEVEIQRKNGQRILELAGELSRCGITDSEQLQITGAGQYLEGNPAEAVSTLQRAMQMGPDPTVAAILSEYAGRSGNQSQTKTSLALVDRLKGQELFWENNAAQAIPLLEQSTKRNPEDAVTWYYLGQSRLQSGQRAAAAEAFRHCLKRNANHQRAIDAMTELEAHP